MGAFVSRFSSDTMLAGAANIFTLILGIWALITAARWVYASYKVVVWNSLSKTLAVIVENRRRHIRQAASEATYLLAYVGYSGAFAAYGMFGVILSALSVASDKCIDAVDAPLCNTLVGAQGLTSREVTFTYFASFFFIFIGITSILTTCFPVYLLKKREYRRRKDGVGGSAKIATPDRGE